MKSIRYACSRAIHLGVMAVLLIGSITAFLPFLSSPVSAQLVPLDVLPPDAPSLTAPVDGAAYRAANLPVEQQWTSSPGALNYTYESYSSNPENGAASVMTTETFSQSKRTIESTTPEGTYYWRVKANGITGSSDWSSVRSFSVDNTAPVTVHDLGNYVGGTVSIAQRIDDVSPKEGSLTITKISPGGGAQYGAGTFQVNANNQIIYSLDTAALFGDGQYEAAFVARDKAGNESTTTHVFTVDRTAPTVTSDGPYGASSGETITLGGTVSEPVTEIFVTIDSIGYPAVVTGNTWSVDVDTSGLAAGDYEVGITATDLAGNVGNVTTSLTVGTVLGEVTGPELEGTDMPPLPPIVLAPPLVAGLPIITSPSATKVEEPAPEDATAEEDDPPGEIEGGVSDLQAFAQTADTDATDGSFWGLDWYWWLLIVGGGVATTGWLISVFRQADPRG